MAPLALKLAPYAAVVALVAAGYFYVSHLKSTIKEQETSLVRAEEEKFILTNKLESVTRDKEILEKQRAEADQKRAALRAELDKLLARFRSQKPPVECKAAIDWAVQNKGDLNW